MNLQSIIYIDDDNFCRTLAEFILEDAEIEVVGLASESECLAWLAEHSADCVLTDVNLGGESGVDIAKKLAELYPDLPVILVTSHRENSTPLENLSENIRGVINKPFNTDTFVTTIAQMILGKSAPVASHDYLNDEIDALRQNYIASLKQDISSFEAMLLRIDALEAMPREYLEEIRDFSHRVSGTSGIYGLSEMCDIAFTIEEKAVSLLASHAVMNAEIKHFFRCKFLDLIASIQTL